ncbi:MAG: Nif11-like leader peptide family RiPP precursor [Lachnospiraceae bacterium]|nr:Nif11-like leader peptide family RiPP precursor [Lachnospiraceae bacterium]
MTENLKKLAEFISTQDKETLKKVSRMSVEELASYARENGIEVTPEELEKAKERRNKEDSQLSEDELETVAGGLPCFCYFGSYGSESGYAEILEDGSELWTEDLECFCNNNGSGEMMEKNEVTGLRCSCYFGGEGTTVGIF